MKHKMIQSKSGLSNVSISALVMISLLVSVVGTWLVLESLHSSYVAAPVVSKSTQTGVVKFDVKSTEPKLANNGLGPSGLVTLKIQ